MTSEKDKKDHLLTLRIPKQWVATLEKMRDQFSEKGEKRSVAHIVRDSLRDTVKEHQTHDQVGERRRFNRLYELQKDKAQALSSIREMIVRDSLIPRAEWEFLCLQSSAAYRLRTRNIYNSALLMDVVKAFEAYVKFRNRITNKPFPDERYFQSNLLSPKNPHAESSLEANIEHTLDVIGQSPISTVGGYFIVRNLEVCLQDETLILEDEDIHDCFKPYARSMLTLSAHHYYETSLRQTGKQQTYCEYLGHDWMTNKWSKRYENDGFALKIERHGESVTALLTIESGWNAQMHCLTFPGLEDFFVAVAHDEKVGAYQGIDQIRAEEKYCFVIFDHGSNRSCIEKPRYERLKNLVAEVVRDSEYIAVRDEAKLAYGGI